MYSISVYLATITVVQSPFSLQGGASRQGGGCESSPLASQDREMLSSPPLGFTESCCILWNCASKQDLPACLCICQNSRLKSLSCYRGVFWRRKAFSSAASSILMGLFKICARFQRNKTKQQYNNPTQREKCPFHSAASAQFTEVKWQTLICSADGNISQLKVETGSCVLTNY